MSQKDVYNLTLSNNANISGKLINYEEFYLIDENKIIHKIILAQKDKGIILKSKQYSVSFNLTDILSIIKLDFKSLFDLYNYFLDLFKKNKIKIINILTEKEMRLIANNIELKGKNESILFILKYSKENDDFNYMKLINENILLKEEINKLKNEIEKIKESFKENKGPQNLKELTQITNDSYSDDVSDNTFTVFKSIQENIFLVYSTKNKSIICYDIIEQNKIIEIKNSHKNHITNFRHFFDKKNKRDIIMTISCADRNIKLWDSFIWECILDLKDIYNEGFIYSSSFLE